MLPVASLVFLTPLLTPPPSNLPLTSSSSSPSRPLRHPRPPLRHPQPTAALLESLRADLQRDDWMPLQTEPRWRNPCFFTSWITAVSVQQALAFGQWPAFGLGPLLVLLSSLVYWRDPQRETWRRTFDLLVVRVGMASHVLLALLLCRPAGVCALLGGYACGGVCYAVGRVLTVRGQRRRGAVVHSGVHVFANLGNLALLRVG